MLRFYLPLFVEQICDNFSFTVLHFDSPSFVTLMFDDGAVISDNLNWYVHSGYTEMTAPSSNINVTNDGESKCSIVNEKLSQIYYTNENKSKRSIVNKLLSHKCSADKNKLRFMKRDKS